jgi:Bacterial aa3 type cytochrome c oxidase subunit IV
METQMAGHAHDHDHTDYIHGAMDIADQDNTFKGFLVWTQWGCVLIGATLVCLTLIFAVGMPWLNALLASAGLALVAGLGMNMGAKFTITVVALTVVGLLAGGISTLVALAL